MSLQVDAEDLMTAEKEIERLRAVIIKRAEERAALERELATWKRRYNELGRNVPGFTPSPEE